MPCFRKDEFSNFHLHRRRPEFIQNEIADFLGERLDKPSRPLRRKTGDPLADGGVVHREGDIVLHLGEIPRRSDADVQLDFLRPASLRIRHADPGFDPQRIDNDLVHGTSPILGNPELQEKRVSRKSQGVMRLPPVSIRTSVFHWFLVFFIQLLSGSQQLLHGRDVAGDDRRSCRDEFFDAVEAREHGHIEHTAVAGGFDIMHHVADKHRLLGI